MRKRNYGSCKLKWRCKDNFNNGHAKDGVDDWIISALDRVRMRHGVLDGSCHYSASRRDMIHVALVEYDTRTSHRNPIAIVLLYHLLLKFQREQPVLGTDSAYSCLTILELSACIARVNKSSKISLSSNPYLPQS